MRQHPRGFHNQPGAGFSLLEVVAAGTLFTLGAIAVAAGLQTGARATRSIQERFVIQKEAQHVLSLTDAIAYGAATDADPTQQDLQEFFDGDMEAGTVTLHQLSRAPEADEGWEFRIGGFPVEGLWRVQVTNDLDLSDTGQVVRTPLPLPVEPHALLNTIVNEQKAFQIRVFFNDALILRSIRTLEVTS